MLWIDTKTDADAQRRSDRLWTPRVGDRDDGSLSARVPGPDTEGEQFWGDAIKDARPEPLSRLAIARRQLPLPGAFREMAVARRAMIRQLRKASKSVDEEVRQLHYWAALGSWALPYSGLLREPGFNVLENTPFALLAALDLGYHRLGCDALPGLNQTDRAWMRQLWGEPASHTTAHALYGQLWREQEHKLFLIRQRRRAALLEEISQASPAATPAVPAAPALPSQPGDTPKRPSLFARLFGAAW